MSGPWVSPIIMSGPMVRALLDGRKTQTRRLALTAKGKPSKWNLMHDRFAYWLEREAGYSELIYVREAMRADAGNAYYVADNHGAGNPVWTRFLKEVRWPGDKVRPSIHMHRWASRLTLKVTAVKIERLQAINEADAEAEGIVEDDGSEPDIWYVPGAATAGWKIQMADRPSKVYRSLWENLHEKKGETWQDNPEVVALSFSVIKANVDSASAAS